MSGEVARPREPGGDVPAKGDLIAGKYEVEGVLGTGGMGVVVAARHRLLGQLVAIKFMRADAARDANAAERFLREARAAVALSSEHVARVIDVATLENGAPYIVMEYLSGVDLSQVIRRDGPMAVPTAVGLVLQACEAIAEAHRLGIVHRDLKPANLFLTKRSDGSSLVRVLDFGISKAAEVTGPEGGQGLTASGIIMGSPSYMSPEQVRSAKGVDARSDIWSLGVILYELLTGISPFQGETLGDTFAKITSEAPPPFRERRPDIPTDLDATIRQCLERKVSARIQSVGELVSRLRPFAWGEGQRSADRISRSGRPGSSGTLAAPEVTPVVDGAGQAPSGTEKPWLRSGGISSGAPAKRWSPLVVGAGLVVAAVALGLHYVRPGQTQRGPSAGNIVAPPLGLPGTLLTSTPSSSAPSGVTPAIADSPPAPPRAASSSRPQGTPVPTPSASPALPSAGVAKSKRTPPRPFVQPVAGLPQPIGTPTPTTEPPPPRADVDPLRCSPPYVIDAAGHREYKPECL